MEDAQEHVQPVDEGDTNGRRNDQALKGLGDYDEPKGVESEKRK